MAENSLVLSDEYEPIPKTRNEKLQEEAAALRAKATPGAGEVFVDKAIDTVLGPLSAVRHIGESKAVRTLRREGEQAHGIASGLGTLAGFAGGAISGTGMPGMLVGLGGRAAAGTASALGGGALAKAAGTMAGAQVETIGMALSEATGEGIIDRYAGVPGASIDLSDAIGAGAKVGAAAGVLGIVLPKTADLLFRGMFKQRIKLMSKTVEERLEHNKTYNALTNELKTIESQNTPEGLRRAREFAVATGSKNRYNKILGDPGFPQRVETPVASSIGGRIATNTASGDEPLIYLHKKLIKAKDDKIGKIVTQSLEELGEKAKVGVVEGAVDAATLAIGGPKAWIFGKLFRPSVQAMQAMLYKGMTHLPPVRWAMSNALLTGKASGALKKMVLRDEGLVPIDTSIDMYVDAGKAFAKALKIPALRIFSSDEISDISDEMVTAEPAKLEMGVRFALASQGVPQQVASSIVADTVKTLGYLQSVMPPVHPAAWVVRERKPVVSETQRAAFSKAVRAVAVPPSVIADFLAGKLTREAAKAWWETQTEWAEMFAEHLRNTVDLATAMGRRFTPQEKLQIGLMVNRDGTKLGRTRDPLLVQSLQGQYQSEEQQTPPPQVGGPKPTGDPGAAAGMGKGYYSQSQVVGAR